MEDSDGFTIEEIGYINHEIEQTSESSYIFSSDDPIITTFPVSSSFSNPVDEGPELPVSINIFWIVIGIGIPVFFGRFRYKQPR